MRKLLRNKKPSYSFVKNQQGFTIVEILVALFLIALVLSLALSDNFSTSDDLDKEASNMQRAVRFMSDESALRNSVVRLHFLLDKEPQEYAVEYGPGDSFILPPAQEFETATLSPEEEEKIKKSLKATNMKFNKIQEFQESNTEISENVKVLGIGHATSKRLSDKGEVSLYAFPTGEKDDALIIMASDEEVVSLRVNPFSQDVDKKSYKLENIGNRDLIIIQKEKAKEIFEEWLKEK